MKMLGVMTKSLLLLVVVVAVLDHVNANGGTLIISYVCGKLCCCGNIGHV